MHIRDSSKMVFIKSVSKSSIVLAIELLNNSALFSAQSYSLNLYHAFKISFTMRLLLCRALSLSARNDIIHCLLILHRTGRPGNS